ncbi:phasin family protein [Alphaproteobacteria bacterium HT1-32]|nr:phasin family protein [Alphaproteobacteria bacterium HT1-32]
MAFWKDFDPAKMMGDMQAPGIDVQSIVQFQQRNLEALAAANRTAFEGAQAVMARQAEILREAMEEMRGAVESMSTKNLPEDVVVQQTDMMKQSFEKTVSNMRELSEMMAKSNTQAVDEVNRRIGESLEELKSNIKKAKG